jgi:acyl carrier protein
MVRITKLTREEVVTALEDCLSFLSKGKNPRAIHSNLDVLREWSLDSEHGVELACDLSTRLGIEIPDNENPLIEENLATKKKRARTFGEVVDYILNLSKT